MWSTGGRCDVGLHSLDTALAKARHVNVEACRKVVRVTVERSHFHVVPMRYVLYYTSEDDEGTWSVYREYYESRQHAEPIDGLTRWVSSHATEEEADDIASDHMLFGLHL